MALEGANGEATVSEMHIMFVLIFKFATVGYVAVGLVFLIRLFFGHTERWCLYALLSLQLLLILFQVALHDSRLYLVFDAFVLVALLRALVVSLHYPKKGEVGRAEKRALMNTRKQQAKPKAKSSAV